MKINQTIRQRRQALGLTQEQLAQQLGVSAQAVGGAVGHNEISITNGSPPPVIPISHCCRPWPACWAWT